MADNPKKLELSTDDKVWLGVCGGMAKYFDVDASLVRVIWVIGTFFTGVFPGVIAYVVCAMVIPKPSS